MSDDPADPAQRVPPSPEVPAVPQRPVRRPPFALEGRAAPALYVLGWFFTIAGLAVLVFIIAANPTRDTARSIIAEAALVAVLLGLVAGAGSQALQRRADGQPAFAPSPFLLFAAVYFAVSAIFYPFVYLLGLAGIKLSDGWEFFLELTLNLGVYVGLVHLLVVGTHALTWREIIRPTAFSWERPRLPSGPWGPPGGQPPSPNPGPAWWPAAPAIAAQPAGRSIPSVGDAEPNGHRPEQPATAAPAAITSPFPSEQREPAPGMAEGPDAIWTPPAGPGPQPGWTPPGTWTPPPPPWTRDADQSPYGWPPPGWSQPSGPSQPPGWSPDSRGPDPRAPGQWTAAGWVPAPAGRWTAPTGWPSGSGGPAQSWPPQAQTGLPGRAASWQTYGLASPAVPRSRWGGRTLLMDVVLGLLLVVPSIIASSFLTIVLMSMFGLRATDIPSTEPTTFPTELDRILIFLGAAVIAPIGEEIFFRGYATNTWARRMTWARTVGQAALFFAFIHILNIVGADANVAFRAAVVAFAARIPVSFALTWLYLRQHSIWASLTLHAVYNGLLMLVALNAAGLIRLVAP